MARESSGDPEATVWVQDFADGSRDQAALLGGKGANLAEMTRVLGSQRVPAGFTITTAACVTYMESDGNQPAGLTEQVDAARIRLEQAAGRELGDPSDPLLVSVRSGARESMPGMLDSVLNLGLNDETVEGLAAKTNNARFAWDSYRRLIQMYGTVVVNVAGDEFEHLLDQSRSDSGVSLDSELSTEALIELVAASKKLVNFPQDPFEQLSQAIKAVFDSWAGGRAVAYRRINHIPDIWGTAVNVQQMVFGNKGPRSGSGVAFSRDEVTGAPNPSGDFLSNAQGEDVVSGARTPEDLSSLASLMPDAHAELLAILDKLERHYGDMQDTEFTIEEERLYMLQTRSAKRPAQAAVRFAVDSVAEGLLTKDQAISTIDTATLESLLHPTFDPSVNYETIAVGVAASPGAASGAIVLTSAAAIESEKEGRNVILVRRFTEADDVAGFHAARGILTSEGGKASHAALVARGMGRPAVTGAGSVEVDLEAGTVQIGDRVLRAGDQIAINGTTGEITSDDVPLIEPEISAAFRTVLDWCSKLQRMEVRANADTPDDARRALELGARGIGLCRTEHMFLGDRQPLMAAVILAKNDAERNQGLEVLKALQEQDFAEIFGVMEGLPVTIRLLDPPLHEFLPRPETLDPGPTRDRVVALQETNPMLGTRGVRLGILFPAIYQMQAEAIFAAAIAVREVTGKLPQVEIMIPLVDYEKELSIARSQIEEAAALCSLRADTDYQVGTMIELPRACVLADRIAEQADFFSFGTNDLTQTTLGFSRDDIEARILSSYIDAGIVDRSPFETIDAPGVGQLVRMAAWLGRTARPDLHLGVCGEHAGDPDSIAFFEESGIDYVSCSPYRIPVARVAAAQAAINRSARQSATKA
jgi:pyruvate, orthophosphate dikinase